MNPDERELHRRLHEALAADDHVTVELITAQLDAADAERLTRLSRPGALIEAAIWYCRAGIPVFPLKAGQKVPATKRGFYDATTDVDKVRAWWQATPQANIGLPTGHVFTVIDVDLPDGYRSLGQMRAEGILPPVHGRVITASGGTHLYVTPTGDGNAAGILPGIDIRGIGGYVVAPPSRSVEGMWMWTVPLDLEALRTEAGVQA